MDMLWAIVIGIIAGVIAKTLMQGDREMSGFILTAVLGVSGAIAASWASRKFGLLDNGPVAAPLAAMGGAVVVLGLWVVLTRRR